MDEEVQIESVPSQSQVFPTPEDQIEVDPTPEEQPVSEDILFNGSANKSTLGESSMELYEGLGESFVVTPGAAEVPVIDTEELLQTPTETVDEVAVIEEASGEKVDEPVVEDGKAGKLTAFPVGRVKKMIKLDSDVGMISHEAALLTAKAAEMFVGVLAKESHLLANLSKKKTIHGRDLKAAIEVNERLSFLDGALEGIL